MNHDRRNILGGIAALSLALSVVSAAPAHAADADVIDTRVDLALEKLFEEYPDSRDLASRASGILVMPRVIKGGFLLGGAYGEGALRVGDASRGFDRTEDYYSVASASVGFQAGGQQTSHALLFMTDASLARFREADGWEAGVDAEITYPYDGYSAGADSTTLMSKPIIAFTFGESGVLIGASLRGSKYSRLER